MCRFVGYLWCALLPVVTSATQVLSRDDLLQAWNDTCANLWQSWEWQDSIPEIIQQIMTPDYGGSESRPECVLPYVGRIFDAQPCRVKSNFNSRAPLVFFAFAATRRSPDDAPAALLVDFKHTQTIHGYHYVPEEYIEERQQFMWPAPWGTLREALSIHQRRHLPVALRWLLHPGFEDACWSSPYGYHTSVRTPGEVDDPAGVNTLPYTNKTLDVSCYYVTWNELASFWGPTVSQETGWPDTLSLYNNTNSPIRLSVTWSPRAVSGLVSLAPCYPGPFWYTNVNDWNDGEPDYILSQSALEYIAQEFVDNGNPEDNPFGNASWKLYAVFPVDSRGVPRIDCRLRLKATLVGPSEDD